MLKQEVLLYFICFCNRGVQGGAGARNGWGEGDCLSGWRDLFIPLDHRGDDLDAGLPKILLKDPPTPPPTLPLPGSAEPLEVALKNHQIFQEQLPPVFRPGGVEGCAAGSAAPSLYEPADPRLRPHYHYKAGQA